jgi:hypothetical protein
MTNATAVPGVELGQQPPDVGLQRRLAEVQLGGDLAVGPPGRGARQHVALARFHASQSVRAPIGRPMPTASSPSCTFSRDGQSTNSTWVATGASTTR